MTLARTKAGREAVRFRGLFRGETDARASAWVRKIEDEAVAAHQERLAVDDVHWHRGPSASCSICRFGTSEDKDHRYSGLISVARNANERGYPIHVATRGNCAEHLAEGDDKKTEFAFAPKNDNG